MYTSVAFLVALLAVVAQAQVPSYYYWTNRAGGFDEWDLYTPDMYVSDGASDAYDSWGYANIIASGDMGATWVVDDDCTGLECFSWDFTPLDLADHEDGVSFAAGFESSVTQVVASAQGEISVDRIVTTDRLGITAWWNRLENTGAADTMVYFVMSGDLGSDGSEVIPANMWDPNPVNDLARYFITIDSDDVNDTIGEFSSDNPLVWIGGDTAVYAGAFDAYCVDSADMANAIPYTGQTACDYQGQSDGIAFEYDLGTMAAGDVAYITFVNIEGQELDGGSTYDDSIPGLDDPTAFPIAGGLEEVEYLMALADEIASGGDAIAGHADIVCGAWGGFTVDNFEWDVADDCSVVGGVVRDGSGPTTGGAASVAVGVAALSAALLL